MCHNHGYSMYFDHGVQTGVVTCDEGVFQFIPPENEQAGWQIRQLYDQPVSDAVLCDFDGDGEPELGCISPFHGDELYVCKKNAAGQYEKVWQHPEKLEMLHATWACTLCGKPVWIVGHRKGARDLMLDGDVGAAGRFHPDAGAAQPPHGDVALRHDFVFNVLNQPGAPLREGGLDPGISCHFRYLAHCYFSSVSET